MAKVIFTPWKDQSQLVAVRNQFYPPPTYDGPDMRSKACATLRGNLPHPVEATALLTDAILHDDSVKNSIFSIRATYSAAFCRFVTGLVDSKLHGQRKTMFQRAMDLGLPASFVELRHEATHRELPSLIVLRNATQRSLEWLWDYYWAKTDVTAMFAPEVSDASDGMGSGNLGPVQAAIKANLDQLLGEGESSEPPLKKRKAQQHLTSVATQLASICKECEMGAGVLSRALVHDSILLSEKKTGDSVVDAFKKWDRFLWTIVDEYPAFLTTLTEEMVNMLAFTQSDKEDDCCRGVYMWLDHILGSTEWESKRRLLCLSYVSAVCEESTNYWVGLLKDRVCNEDNIVSLSGGDVSAEILSSPETVLKDASMAGMTDQKELQKYGWDSIDTWDSRPLGVV
ncbi:hypothetical protein EYZ11_010476 [Aspergillus tanneri]|uniref:rRNA-processing protein las1 n=1 Tax=Aspergillus tanneri TaxID=1220188 RepID=A0A4S3J599_9EURO|nr:hypothetical protein EYZ11_010476 [Aspergillus tanneri]